MNRLAAFALPCALLLPAAIAAAPLAQDKARTGGSAHLSEESATPKAQEVSGSSIWQSLAATWQGDERSQVRVQQRVIIRVTPQQQPTRQDLVAQLPRGEVSAHFEERKLGDCIEAKSIAGMQASTDNRLLLFMRDRKIVSAALEKACNANDFYSGFYVERQSDGKICVKRDKLKSRSGAECQLSLLSRLVVVRD